MTVILFAASFALAVASIVAGPFGFLWLMVAVGLFIWAADRWLEQRERETRGQRRARRRRGFIA